MVIRKEIADHLNVHRHIKTFYSMDHYIVIMKSENLSLKGIVVNWIESYLSN